MSKNAQRDQSDDIRGVARALTDPRVMEELLFRISSKAQRTLLEFFKFFHRKGLNINLKNGVKCKKDIHFLFGQRSWNNQAQKRFYDFPLENRILVAYLDLPTSNQIHNSRKKKKTKDTAKRDDIIRNRAEMMYRSLRRNQDDKVTDQHVEIFKNCSAQAIAQGMYEKLYSLEDNSMDKVSRAYQDMADKLASLEDSVEMAQNNETESALLTTTCDQLSNPHLLFDSAESTTITDSHHDTTSAPFWNAELHDEVDEHHQQQHEEVNAGFLTEENTFKLDNDFGSTDADMDDHTSLFTSTYASTSPSHGSISDQSFSPRGEAFTFDPFETISSQLTREPEVFSLNPCDDTFVPAAENFVSYVPAFEKMNHTTPNFDHLFVDNVFDSEM